MGRAGWPGVDRGDRGRLMGDHMVDRESNPLIAARDRRELAREQGQKTEKWPRTARRQARISQTLLRRQTDLTFVLEDVHDRHNVSAVLRSCDAVGILTLHVVYRQDRPPEDAFARTTSSGAVKWVDVVRHDSVASCYAALRDNGMTILATALEADSHDLYDLDLTRPTALVFGNEQRGVSDEARTAADGTVASPMLGMVESLNISVACAVTAFEAMRQRRAAGAYDRPGLAVDVLESMEADWLLR